MKKLRTLAIIIAGLWGCVAVNAYDFVDAGIYFSVTSEADLTVKVTYKNSSFGGYTEAVIIPTYVSYSGNTYKVTEIGSDAFYNCSYLTSVSIPSSVTSIGNRAFYNCARLTSVSIPSSVKSIGSSIFMKCTSLASISIPNSVTSIGSNIFTGCTNLQTCTLSENINSIGDSFFSGCTSLTSITLPSKITTIGQDAFKGCSSLCSVSMSEGIVTIGADAFYDCTSLTSISIPGTVTTLDNAVFHGCKKLEKVYFLNGAEKLTVESDYGSDPYTFYQCTSLKYLYLGRDLSLYSGTITNPSVWCPSPFARKGFETIELGETVTSINDYLFYGCTNVSSFKVNSTTPPSIGIQSFMNVPRCELQYPEGCYESYANSNWRTNFTIPLKDFNVDGIFYNVLSLSDCTVEVTFQGNAYNSYADEYSGDVVIPETVTYGGKTFTVTAIGLSAFSGCQNLTSVTLPSTITKIDEYGFNYCTSLKSVNLPEGLMTIGPRAFRICHSLTSMEIPATVTTIGESAFYECKALQSVAFKGSVESIGSGAFNLCPALTKVSVDNISDWCGMGFNDLTASPLAVNLVRDANNGVITGNTGSLYVNGEKLTELVVPDDVEIINDYAFYAFDELASIDFGKGLKSIGNSAFAWCHNLTSLTIPGNVTSIEREAFWGCQEVSQITIEDSEETLSLGCIGNNTTEGNTSGLFSTCRLSQPLYIGRNLSYAYDFNVSPFSLINGYYEKMGTVTFGELVTEIPPYLLYNSGAYVSDVYFQFRSNPIIGTNAFAPNQEIHLALDDAESTDFNAANENTFASAEYNRSLEKGKFGTIMLPFAPKNDKYVFFKLTKVEGNVLTFDEESEPKANTPYLYRLRDDAENGAITAEGSVTIVADIANPDVVSNWQMVGSFINQIIETENLDTYYYGYAASDNKLHRVTKKMTVKPYRAYFTTNGNQPAQLAVRTRDGETTLVDAAEVEDLTPETYYDLSGRRVENPIKGVYIVNGKKVIR